MEEKRNGKPLFYIIMSLIFILQIANFWRCYFERGAYAGDEYLSLQYANYYTSDINIEYYKDMPEWEYGTWIDVDTLQETYSIDKEEVIFSQPFEKALSIIIKKPIFWGFLNVIGKYCDTTSEFMSAVIWLNIIITICTELVLARLLYDIAGERKIIILFVLLYGFCGAVITLTTFVRFYGWIMFCAAIVLRYHFKILKTQSKYKMIEYVLIALVSLYVAVTNSETAALFGGCLAVCFIILLIIRREYNKLIIYICPISLGGIYILRVSGLIQMLFDRNHIASENNRLLAAAESVFSFNSTRLLANFQALFQIIKIYCFGSSACMYFSICAILLAGAFLCIDFFRKRSCSIKIIEVEYSLLLLFTSVLFYAGIVLASLTARMRYSAIGIEISILVYAITISYCIKKIQIKNFPYYMAVIVVILGGILTSSRGYYEYSYRDSKDAYLQLESYKNCDTVLIYNHGHHTGNYINDCVAHCNPGYKMYLTKDNDDKEKIDMSLSTNNVIIWTEAGDDIDNKLESIKEQGYLIKPLGDTYCSYILIGER